MAKTPLDVRSIARGHTASAIRTLAAIMNMSDAPHAARVSAAQALLDRGWGRPSQAIVGGDENDRPVQIQMLERIIVDPQNRDSASIPAPTATSTV